MAESFDSARALILDRVTPLPTEEVKLIDAGERILAGDIHAPCELPRWDNSAMDGYAVHCADSQPGSKLLICGYIPAGETADHLEVTPGTAIKIMTGAPLPAGAQAVVPIEDASEENGTLHIRKPFQAGDHIRFRGEDIQQGEPIISAGSLIRPSEINLLASFGIQNVAVHRRPQVAILSTGDELVEPGEPIGPGQIANSNAYSLAVAVKAVGGEPLLLGIARDNQESLREKLSVGLQTDALITSAGVSMGDRDLVCEMLLEAGVEQLFWKVDIKPGRPTAFGMKDGRPVFSLPGNPVSTMVTFEEFVRPALLKMQGHKQVIKPYAKAVLNETVEKKPGRLQFMRVHLCEQDDQLVASSSGNQHTAMVKTMLRANGIAVLPADRRRIDAGEKVAVHRL